MRNLNLDDVEEAQEYKRVCAGGYVCKITAVEDIVAKEYLKIEYDIVEGEFKGYYKALFDSKQFWGGSFIRSYKTTALSFFKAFITAVENSNSEFKFGQDESKLVGKLVGLILSEEEYRKNDGTVGVRFACQPRSVEIIRNGVYEVPACKSLKVSSTPSNAIFTPIDDDSLPF
jgi:hypothetical protein